MSDEKAGKGPFALIYRPDWKIYGDRHHTPCIMPHIWPWDVELPEGWAVLPLIWPASGPLDGPEETVAEAVEALTDLAQGKPPPPDSDNDPIAVGLLAEANRKDLAYKLVDLIEGHKDHQDILEVARRLYHALPDGGGE